LIALYEHSISEVCVYDRHTPLSTYMRGNMSKGDLVSAIGEYRPRNEGK
jgi:hypothetical protein